MQCAAHERDVSQPISSNCSAGRRPNVCVQYLPSSGVPAR